MTKGLVEIWTDGSCNNTSNNQGGFGVVMTFLHHRHEISGGSYYSTTSQRLELLAVITALETLKLGFKVKLYCDAEYITKAINLKTAFRWESQAFVGRANADLWKRLLKAYRRFPNGHVDIIWIRSHAGNRENDRADDLARQGGNNFSIIQDLDEISK